MLIWILLVMIQTIYEKAIFHSRNNLIESATLEFKSKNKKQLCCDEYGNIQALTIEDIFEEIVGDYLEEPRN